MEEGLRSYITETGKVYKLIMFTETETETLAEKLTNRDITDYTDSRNHLNRKTELTVTHGGGSVMLWAASRHGLP